MKLVERFSNYRKLLEDDIKQVVSEGKTELNVSCGEIMFVGLEKLDGKLWVHYLGNDGKEYEEHLNMFTMDELFVLCSELDRFWG